MQFLIASHEKNPDDLIILGFNDYGTFKKVFINNTRDKIAVLVNKETRDENKIFELARIKLGRSDRAYYLWPDGIYLHFFIFAIVLSAPVLLNLLTWPICLNDILKTLPVVFALFSFILWGLPLFIFYLFRVPVLDYLYNKLPETTSDIVRKSVKEGTFKNIAPSFSSLFNEKWDQVYYSSKASFRGSLLRVALRDMYQKQREEDASTARYSSTITRWIFYWCSPVWGSFLCLVIISFIIAHFDQHSSLQNNLVYSSILWVGCSIYYIKKVAKELSTWTSYTQEHSRYLPSVLAGKIRELPFVVNDISEKNIEKVTSVISGFVATTYISLIKFFIFLP